MWYVIEENRHRHKNKVLVNAAQWVYFLNLMAKL